MNPKQLQENLQSIRVGGGASSGAIVNETSGAHFAALEQRVSGLEGSLKDIAGQISGLSNKLDERGKTPWGIIITGAGVAFSVVVAIGGLAYAPIVTTQARLEFDMREHYRELRADINRVDKDTPSRLEYDRGRAVNDRTLERIERRIDRLEYGKGNT